MSLGTTRLRGCLKTAGRETTEPEEKPQRARVAGALRLRHRPDARCTGEMGRKQGASATTTQLRVEPFSLRELLSTEPALAPRSAHSALVTIAASCGHGGIAAGENAVTMALAGRLRLDTVEGSWALASPQPVRPRVCNRGDGARRRRCWSGTARGAPAAAPRAVARRSPRQRRTPRAAGPTRCLGLVRAQGAR